MSSSGVIYTSLLKIMRIQTIFTNRFGKKGIVTNVIINVDWRRLIQFPHFFRITFAIFEMSLKSSQRENDNAWTNSNSSVDNTVVQRGRFAFKIRLVVTRVHEYSAEANTKREEYLSCCIAPDFNGQQLIHLLKEKNRHCCYFMVKNESWETCMQTFTSQLLSTLIINSLVPLVILHHSSVHSSLYFSLFSLLKSHSCLGRH